MNCDHKVCEVSTQSDSQNSRKIGPILLFSFVLVNLLLSERHRHSSWTIAWAILIFIFLISTASSRLSVRFLHWIIGTIEHVQIYSPEIEQRIRARYQSEISQLTDLGFNYLFSDGETFSLFRLVLILPAITVIHMRCKGEVMTLHDGTKLLTGHPVLISKNKNTFGYTSGLGAKFYSAFQDGTLLVSKAYADADIPAGPMIRKYARKASISDTWIEHQERISALESEGKRVDCQTSFQVWAEISEKETAAW